LFFDERGGDMSGSSSVSLFEMVVALGRRIRGDAYWIVKQTLRWYESLPGGEKKND